MEKMVKMTEQKYDKCKGCICSVCLIAETNGGAPGCGNCDECKGTNPCHNCGEFYSPMRYSTIEYQK